MIVFKTFSSKSESSETTRPLVVMSPEDDRTPKTS